MFRRPLIVCLLPLLAVGGCATGKQRSTNEKINQWLLASEVDVPPVPYLIQPPDVIVVSSPMAKELDGQGGAVRSDGKFVFNLVGPLDVAGKTTDQVAQDLKRLYRRYYNTDKLDLIVRVTEYRSKFVYVFGQVTRPGPKPYTGRDSALRVLADAGFNQDAWPERVVVVRPHEDPGIKQKITIDVAGMYERGDMSQNVLLEDGDLLYVPPTPLAQLNVTFAKLLAPIRPASALLGVATGRPF